MALVGKELNTHANVLNGARCLNFGLSHHLYSYFVYASSRCSGESVLSHSLVSIGESPAQFENPINPRVYVRRVTHSTMYEKAPFC